jgi:hypothetical protein
MASWLFADSHNGAAARHKQEVIAKIDAWWKEFQTHVDDLKGLFSNQKRWDLPGWMQQHLQGIDERLMWEFGPDYVLGGHRLVITPEAKRTLRPVVETMLERAPKLPGWSFLAYRPPESEEIARKMVQARVGQLLPEPITVRASVGDLHRIDLTFESPDFPRRDQDTPLQQAFVAVESLLGEELLDKWVGAIDTERTKPGKHSLRPDRLKDTVDALIGSVHDQLPKEHYAATPPPDKGAVIRLQPEERDDYPGKSDMLVASTMRPDILLATLKDPSFYSQRYSRHGERFAYLKIDGSDPGDMKFQDRTEMEDAIDPALREARVGCVHGGGTGLRYSYIDLVLSDVSRGYQVIRDVLRQGRIPHRTWLLFCDCEWRDEWLGIWDDTPAPPMDAD